MTGNNIEFAFLKGAALVLNKTYNDFGERMIGDIDILIDENDYIEAIAIFKNMATQIKYIFFLRGTILEWFRLKKLLQLNYIRKF